MKKLLSLVFSFVLFGALAGYAYACIKTNPEPCTENCPTDIEVVPVPTPEPKSEPLTPAGPPPAKECKKIEWAPTIVWVRQDNKEFSWTQVSNDIRAYWIEYRVGGSTYTVVSKNPSYEFTERVESIRVAGLDDEAGCVGPFSQWSNTSLPSGSK